MTSITITRPVGNGLPNGQKTSAIGADPTAEFVPSTMGMLFAINALPRMDRDDTKLPGNLPVEPSASERRRQSDERLHMVSVRLLRKYAEMIDGVNLKKASVGDQLDLSRRDANILIAEGWAEPADDERGQRALPRSLAADSSGRSRKKPDP